MDVQVRYKGISAEGLARVINRSGIEGKRAANLAALAQARLLRTAIMRNASGRPGPNIVTGDYRRSWGPPRRVGTGLLAGGYIVGTASPQGPRLEYGFWNKTDSLGRTFRQPARPHVRPALRVIERTFPVAVLTAVRKSMAEQARSA